MGRVHFEVLVCGFRGLEGASEVSEERQIVSKVMPKKVKHGRKHRVAGHALAAICQY